MNADKDRRESDFDREGIETTSDVAFQMPGLGGNPHPRTRTIVCRTEGCDFENEIRGQVRGVPVCQNRALPEHLLHRAPGGE